MTPPTSSGDADESKQDTISVVNLAHSQSLPTLPFDLKDHVSLNTWAVRMSRLTQIASRHYRPALDRFYMFFVVLLTIVVPVGTYYLVFLEIQKKTKIDSWAGQAWLARLCSLAIMLATYLVLYLPMAVWKRMGKVRAKRLAEEWTQTDALTGPVCGGAGAPVWTVMTPGLFKGTIVLKVTLPKPKKTHFSWDGYLPPYIAAGEDALPPYEDSNRVRLSKDSKGGVKYGDIPIYNDDAMTVIQV